jgi:hypothetical protein
MTIKESPFRPDRPFYSKRAYQPRVPVDPGQESMFTKYALMDLSEVIPFAFFHPRYIYVTRNGYLGEDRIITVPTPGFVEMVALYVPIEIQQAWFHQYVHDKPESVIVGAVENFLRQQMRPYTEEK